ncbi:acyltransferase family protein [Paenibacillus sp. LHD-38]|uniref:acyltransferase family protein n=1 Tax=Paenibacillus sp. LHD-38 TaxID=3072143 RepID=UPI00280E4128|nr:acyltransferase family protein [Paenibacillus sp. LHD-38]MDQ8738220.1 acyltransferase family protein [Paenibacillus sp. LHD-38]
MPKPIGNSGRYMPGLDGLRAIAVLAVIAYHLNLKAVPGGLLGVSMFFVLSGYLITDILLKQLGQRKSIDLKTFFIRRARRLLPAMFLMIAFVSLWLMISDADRLFSLKGDIGSALLYISNWWLIFHEVSYFESFGPESPFGHLWSLAVEEQFYLVWPLVLIAVIRFVPKRGMLALWTLAAAAISAGAMALLYQPGMDPSRVYYGTDTRAFALLIGAALAVVWPSWKLSASVSVRGRLLLDTVGTAGLIIILFMIGQTGEYDASLYRGGMVLLAIATAAVVAATAHPASKLAQLIGSKFLAWIGVRSYGIYLYHYPIIVLTTPTAEIGELQPVRALIQVALTFVLAELSWRFVEEPIRHGALGKLFALLKKQALRISLPQFRKSTSYFAGIVLIVSCVSCTSSVDLQSANSNGSDIGTVKPGHSNEAAELPNTEKHMEVGQGGTVTKPDSNGQDKPAPTPTSTSTPTPEDPASSIGKPSEEPGSGAVGGKKQPDTVTAGGKPVTDTTTDTEAAGSSSGTAKPSDGNEPDASGNVSKITAIGDSVLLDAGPYLEKRLPGIHIDGKVGRQFSQAEEIINELKRNSKLGDKVIIELGTNGAFTAKQMNALLDAIGEEREVIMVNTRVPRKWQDTVNKMLAETAKNNKHVTVVDWYSASKGKEDFFSKDGVHLKTHGAEFYADLLADAI